MGFLGNVIGGKQTYGTTRNTKNPAIQASLDQLLADYRGNKGQNAQDLSSFISQYTAGNGDATKRTNQEISDVDRYYNGDVESQLAQMRARRGAAMTAAGQQASLLALRNRDMARLHSDTGLGSYDKRLALGNENAIQIQNALDQAGQERGDWGFLNGTRLGLMGRRQALADALYGRALVPMNARNALSQYNLGTLGALTNLDQANNFYGLQKNSRGGTADFFDNADQGIGNVFAMVGSAYSGGKAIDTTHNGEITAAPSSGVAGYGGAGQPSDYSRAAYGDGNPQGPNQYNGYNAGTYYDGAAGMSAINTGGYYDYPSAGGYTGGAPGMVAGYDGTYGYGGGDLYGGDKKNDDTAIKAALALA